MQTQSDSSGKKDETSNGCCLYFTLFWRISGNWHRRCEAFFYCISNARSKIENWSDKNCLIDWISFGWLFVHRSQNDEQLNGLPFRSLPLVFLSLFICLDNFFCAHRRYRWRMYMQRQNELMVMVSMSYVIAIVYLADSIDGSCSSCQKTAAERYPI